MCCTVVSVILLQSEALALPASRSDIIGILLNNRCAVGVIFVLILPQLHSDEFSI